MSNEVIGKMFLAKNAYILLKHRPCDCAIDLQDGVQPPFTLISNPLQDELLALKEKTKEDKARQDTG